MGQKYYLILFFGVVLFGGIYGCTNTGLIKDKDFDPTVVNFVQEVQNISVTSVFSYGARIPALYSCIDDDINPPIKIENIPEGAKSLVLIVDDPDSPNGDWVHWVMWNIPLINLIEENSVPEGAIQGVTNFGMNEYGGPCPPIGEHRYFFRVYALNDTLNISTETNKKQLEKAMKSLVIGKGEHMGVFSK